MLIIDTNVLTPEITLLMKQLTFYVVLLVKNTKQEETLHETQKILFMWYIVLKV